MPPKRSSGQRSVTIEEGLAQLSALAGPLKPPANLGNATNSDRSATLEEDQERDRLAGADGADGDETREDGAPDGTDTEGAERDADGEGDGQADQESGASLSGGSPDNDGQEPSTAALLERIEDLQDRAEARDRELDFMRSGMELGAGRAAAEQPPEKQVDPYLVDIGFQITAEDAEQLFGAANPQRAADMFNRALSLVAYRTSQHTGQLLANVQLNREATQSQSSSIVTTFYRDNEELRAFPEIVVEQAKQVWGAMGNASPDRKLEVLNTRVRNRLSDMGVKLTGKTTSKAKTDGEDPPPKKNRLRPAAAEMGGGGRGNGKTKLTKREQQMFSLM